MSEPSLMTVGEDLLDSLYDWIADNPDEDDPSLGIATVLEESLEDIREAMQDAWVEARELVECPACLGMHAECNLCHGDGQVLAVVSWKWEEENGED